MINCSELESEWTLILEKAGLRDKELIHKSGIDNGRRVYTDKKYIYKIVSHNLETTSNTRVNTLNDEYNILRKIYKCRGIPKVIRIHNEKIYSLLVLSKIEAERFDARENTPVGITGMLLKLIPVLASISIRGVSHNDIRECNILINKENRIYLIDFDQAVTSSVSAALYNNFFNINQKSINKGSIMTLLKELLKKNIPERIVRKVKRTLFGHDSYHTIPELPEGSSEKLHKIKKAWTIAQKSKASSPSVPFAYYGITVDDIHFPGERTWKDRWEILRTITDYQGKKVLELGCNMGLLSNYLMLFEGAQTCFATDIDYEILEAAKLISDAFNTDITFMRNDFDDKNKWEDELINYKPDIVFALNVIHWLKDKERFVRFLGNFNCVIIEGHNDLETEVERMKLAGFNTHKLICYTERKRPIILFTK